ncbi:hypothetical protein [Streptomyces sp. NPDC005374]|uniref:hypothetical protein n=1 Tax=Streptomyces sp. NPDC005374 TaxID=3364713 RepID=UPI00369F742C
MSYPPGTPPHSRPPRITVLGRGAVGATLAGAFAASGAAVGQHGLLALRERVRGHGESSGS